MARYINRLGRFATSGFGGSTVTISKKGDWELVELQLNKLSELPDALGRELIQIANNIIRPTLDETKAEGNFAPNTKETSARKGGLNPWNSGEGTTGTAVVEATGTGKSGVSVYLSDAMNIQLYVNYGFYSLWAGDYVEGRDLYGQAWQNCEDEVKSAVDDLIAEYVG